jgi:hypothetical protein
MVTDILENHSTFILRVRQSSCWMVYQSTLQDTPEDLSLWLGIGFEIKRMEFVSDRVSHIILLSCWHFVICSYQC